MANTILQIRVFFVSRYRDPQLQVTENLGWLFQTLKVTYHPLYSMNKFVTNNSKSPQDGAQVFPYTG